MMKWDPFVRVRGEGGIRVTSPEKRTVESNGEEGWDVNLFIRFAVEKRKAKCFVSLSQLSV